MGTPADTAFVSESAHAFLKRLEEFLSAKFPSHSAISEEFESFPGRPNGLSGGKAESYEGPFFKKYVVPNVHKFLITKEEKLDPDKAKKALLAEGFVDLPDFASDTPASKERYPYKKNIVATLRNARNDWWENKASLSNSCPDLALRSPCEHRIVFEGKLFRNGGVEKAKTVLVNGIFEAFFYRGVPTLLRGKEQYSSGYDYACLLAYDASPLGALQKAWREMNKDVALSLWNQLHVYIMILRNG